jgi:hypothetical protein
MENEGASVSSSPGRRFCSTGIDGQPSDRDGRPSSLKAQFGTIFFPGPGPPGGLDRGGAPARKWAMRLEIAAGPL